jgi:Zn-dependent alcohol dehydrogenase
MAPRVLSLPHAANGRRQMFAMLAGGRQLRGILGGDANPRVFLPKLIDYWTQGRFPFEPLITTYDFDEIGQGVPRLSRQARSSSRY